MKTPLLKLTIFCLTFIPTIDSPKMDPLLKQHSLVHLQLNFNNLNERQNIMKQDDLFPQKCVLCGTTMNDEFESNNPFPVSDEGRCCHSCNTSKVIPARIMLARRPKSILDDLV